MNEGHRADTAPASHQAVAGPDRRPQPAPAAPEACDAQPAHLSARQAVLLGLLHGPAELLPVSSSGHLTLLPWLLGWPYPRLDPELRKTFEVALHAGTAAALLVALRHEVIEAARGFDRRRAALVGLSFAPPALIGFTLERPIERRLGTPQTIAIGLIAGSLAMVAGDRIGGTDRRREEAGAIDGLALGLAQACSLVPGVSRNGATLAAARARGFGRVEANELSRHVALPVIVGAALLKGVRRVRGRSARAVGGSSAGAAPGRAEGEVLPASGAAERALGLGAGAAFGSTLASTWVIRQVERDRSPAPYAAYRTALAALVLWRLRNRRHR